MIKSSRVNCNLSILNVFDKILQPAMVVNLSGKVIEVNDSCSKLFRTDRSNLLIRYWTGLDANLNLLKWKNDWKGFSSDEFSEMFTHIDIGDHSLMPVRVRLLKISDEECLILIEDNIERKYCDEVLQYVQHTTSIQYWHYNHLTGACKVPWELVSGLGLERVLNNDGSCDISMWRLAILLKSKLSESSWLTLTKAFNKSLADREALSTAILINEKNFQIEGEVHANEFNVTHLLGTIKPKEIAASDSDPSNVNRIPDLSDEQFFANFTLNNTHEMILWIQFDGTIDFANKTFLERTGYSKQEVIGENTNKFFPQIDDQTRKATWKELRKRKRQDIETFIVDASGDEIPTMAHLRYISHEGKEYDCVYLRDWTRKKQRDTIFHLSSMSLDDASDYIVWLNSDNRIFYINEAFLNIIGHDEQYWNGRWIGKLLPDFDLQKAFEQNRVEYSFKSETGNLHRLSLRYRQQEFEGKTYFSIMGYDITTSHQRERKLQHAYNEINELKRRLEKENLIMREDIKAHFNIDNIITVSPKYKYVLKQASQVAQSDATVLILGETGTGKELLARAIHQLSNREEEPLIKINCAALPESLIESELFGYEKGAFTGAHAQKKGRFEMADGGTLFLDEIGELPHALQVKLLRVLQEGEFERVGGTETISVDVRLIAATNRDLRKMVEQKRFRADLYYRLNVFPIVNLPLRERPEDIPVLVKHFADKFAKRMGKKIDSISTSDLEALTRYSFPGNIRELENIIERNVVLCQGNHLQIKHDMNASIESPDIPEDWKSFDEMQRDYIIKALKQTNGRMTGPKGAGQLLGLNDRTLMSKIRKFQIKKSEYFI